MMHAGGYHEMYGIRHDTRNRIRSNAKLLTGAEWSSYRSHLSYILSLAVNHYKWTHEVVV